MFLPGLRDLFGGPHQTGKVTVGQLVELLVELRQFPVRELTEGTDRALSEAESKDGCGKKKPSARSRTSTGRQEHAGKRVRRTASLLPGAGGVSRTPAGPGHSEAPGQEN